MANLLQITRSGLTGIGLAPVGTPAVSLRADDFWGAIDQLASDHGLTSSGLARKAGLDPTAFNRSKRQIHGRDRWPSSTSIAKVLEATGESFMDFALRVTALQKRGREPSDEGSMKAATMTCAGCDKLIEPGEPRWAGREPDAHWHYACAELSGLARSIHREHVGKEANSTSSDRVATSDRPE